jgi:CRP/FNR family transcriptional regulator
MLAIADAVQHFGDEVSSARAYAPYRPSEPKLTDVLGPVQTLPSREDLFLEGDEASHAYEVLDGIICAYRLLPDGERQIIGFYYPGDVLGYCCLETHAYSAQALTSARLRRIPRATLERSMHQRPGLASKLLQMAALELTATRDHLVRIASGSASAKVASFLLALSRRNRAVGQDPTEIRLPMTRTDIGDYLGLTIETVSRTLSRFKQQGLIDLPRTTQVKIKSESDLRALAKM